MSMAKQKIAIEVAKGDIIKISLSDNVLMSSSNVLILNRHDRLDYMNKQYFSVLFDCDDVRERALLLIPNANVFRTLVEDILLLNLNRGPTEFQRFHSRRRDGLADYLDSESLTHRIRGTLGVYKKFNVKSIDTDSLEDLIDYIMIVYVALVSAIVHTDDLCTYLGEDYYIKIEDLKLHTLDVTRISFTVSLEVSSYAVFHVSP